MERSYQSCDGAECNVKHETDLTFVDVAALITFTKCADMPLQVPMKM